MPCCYLEELSDRNNALFDFTLTFFRHTYIGTTSGNGETALWGGGNFPQSIAMTTQSGVELKRKVTGLTDRPRPKARVPLHN